MINNIDQLRKNINEIEQRINYVFEDKEILVKAFVHRSFCNQTDSNNERMEFLGNGIIEYLASEYVYFKYPSFSEDMLSQYKMLIVNYYTLYKVCLYLNLNDYMVFYYESLGKNSTKIKTFSDLVESLIAAIYLDSKSLEKAKEFFYNIVLKVFYDNIDEIVENVFDWKGFLQSILQKSNFNSVPEYVVVERNGEGFLVFAYLQGVEVSSGFGKTKREAEKQAAFNFIKKINGGLL